MSGPFGTHHPSSSSFGRSLGLRGRAIAAAYTVDPAEDTILIVDTSAAAVTITLPLAADCHNGTSGLVLHVVCTDAGDDVTIDGSGAETIDGAATNVVSGAYAGVTLWCDGTEWYTLT